MKPVVAVAAIVFDAHGRLLVIQRGRPPGEGLWSVPGGKLEPHERLADAVAREVREETGVAVGAVHYHSSQPWPFPANIMLGFYAEATSTEITVDPGELADAQWFARDWLKSHVDDDSFRLPRRDSIARRLIRARPGGPRRAASGRCRPPPRRSRRRRRRW